MKIGFVSLGCPKNLVDGEVMLGFAQQAGHEITPVASNADVIVVNTCAFIDKAKQESIDAILEMAQQKRDGRCSRLAPRSSRFAPRPSLLAPRRSPAQSPAARQCRAAHRSPGFPGAIPPGTAPPGSP